MSCGMAVEQVCSAGGPPANSIPGLNSQYASSSEHETTSYLLIRNSMLAPAAIGLLVGRIVQPAGRRRYKMIKCGREDEGRSATLSNC